MEGSFYNTPGRFPGIFGWIFTTDHKRIGLLYLVSTLAFFFVGVSLGLTMRLELIRSGMHFYSAQTYNAIFTLHGVIMIFLFIIPGIPSSLGNFIMPLQIGARDVAFPKINILSWWLFIMGGAIAVTSLFTGGGPPDTPPGRSAAGR
jgi:cytochrome c oxidase subunit 1